jgi:hypothetical protein
MELRGLLHALGVDLKVQQELLGMRMFERL